MGATPHSQPPPQQPLLLPPCAPAWDLWAAGPSLHRELQVVVQHLVQQHLA
jgi:hypothetical protein